MGQILKYAVLACTSLFAGFAWAEFESTAFDPTAPPQFRTHDNQPQNASRLTWVRVDGRNSIAWYGDTAVRLGERVEGGRVVAIHEDHIVIAGPQGRRTIPLLSAQVRHQPVTPLRSSRHK